MTVPPFPAPTDALTALLDEACDQMMDGITVDCVAVWLESKLPGIGWTRREMAVNPESGVEIPLAEAWKWAAVRIAALEAENAGLRDALKPFADWLVPMYVPDTQVINTVAVTAGMVRAARAARSGPPEERGTP